jgi:hypothetical protein
MSFMSRVGGIIGGFTNLGGEIVETVWDTARSVVTPDEYEGVGDTILGIVQDNLISGVMQAAFGEGSALEQTVGVIPGAVRAPIATFTSEVLGKVDAWQDAYIERPLSAAVMGFNVATQSGLAGFLDGDTYRTAWQIANEGLPEGEYDLSKIPENQQELFTKELSLGRAIAFAMMGTDTLNPHAAAEAAQSSTFNLISGSFDLAETILLDPLLFAGKPIRAARLGKLTIGGVTDFSNVVKGVKRADAVLAPTRALLKIERRTGPLGNKKLGWTNKLDATEIANFTTRRAKQVIDNPNWSKLNDAIEALPSSETMRQLTNTAGKGLSTFEKSALVSRRAGEIMDLLGKQKKGKTAGITQETAMMLAQATNPVMRSNHYRYAMGDQTVMVSALEAATKQSNALLGKAGVLDQIDNLEKGILLTRNQLKEAADKHRQKPKSPDDVDGIVEDKGFDSPLVEELNNAVSQRRALIKEVQEVVDVLGEGPEQFDFGFILDLKTRFSDAQIDNLAAKKNGAYGNDLARFLADNSPETSALIDAATDRWLLDGADYVRGGREILEIIDPGGSGVLGKEGVQALQGVLAERAALDRKIRVPLANKAKFSQTGVAAKVFETASKALPGRRIVEYYSENTSQRYFDTNDALQSGNQFERMIRDLKRFDNNDILSPEEADRYLGQWSMLEGSTQRLNMFETLIGEVNNRIAAFVGEGNTATQEKLLNHLTENYNAANFTFSRSRPEGGRFGGSDRARLSFQDGDKVVNIVSPLTQRQLATSRVLPRYDLVKEALDNVTGNRRFNRVRDRAGKLLGDNSVVNLKAVGRAGSDSAEAIMRVWRPAVLLRPAWPLRVVGDEALRVASVIGGLNLLRGMSSGFSDYRVELMRRKGIDIESGFIAKLKDELGEEAKDLIDEFEIYDAYRQQVKFKGNLEEADRVLSKRYEKELLSQWQTSKRIKGIAARSALGFATLGPIGALGGAVVGAISQGSTARKLAQRELGEMTAEGLQRSATGLFNEATEIYKRVSVIGTADEVAAAAKQVKDLRFAADLLLAKEAKLKEVMKVLRLDPDSKEYQALVAAQSAGVRLQQAGRQPTMIGGVLVRNAIGDNNFSANAIQGRVSADRSTSKLVQGASRKSKNEIDSDFWEQISLDQGEDFVRAWDSTTNKQWKAGPGDPHVNDYLEVVWSTAHSNPGDYKYALTEFLQKKQSGRKTLEDLDIPNSGPEFDAFVEAVYQTQNQIMPQFLGNNKIDDFNDIRNNLGNRKADDVKWEDVQIIRDGINKDTLIDIDNDNYMNLTIGQQARGVTPNWQGSKKLMEFTNNAFTVLASLPTDNLSRLPYFRASFDEEMARKLSAYVDPETGGYIFEGDQLQKIIDKLEKGARNKALGDVRYLLYDLTESTRMQESLSNMMPFLGAWQEVITRWAGIAKENPAYVSRVLDNFNSIPTAEDEEGNRWMILRMPGLEKIGGGGALLKPFVGKNLSFSKDAMSMLSSGGPGFGPLITIPLAEIALVEPSLEEAVEFMWPYGLPQGDNQFSRVIGQLSPAWAKRAKGALAGSDELDRLALTVARDRITALKMQEPTSDDERFETLYEQMISTEESRNEMMRDIKEDAQALLKARAFASMILPTTMKVDSPYSFYLEQWRAMSKEDPLLADERFISEYGSEFLAIIQRTSKTKNGVSPTIESWDNFQKYLPLIEAYPEIGGLVTATIGSDEAQRFNVAVYRRQQSSALSPGSPEKQRERVPLEDFIEAPDIKQGWEEYREIINIRNTELEARKEQEASGSLNAASNADVKQWYSFKMEQLQAAHPGWWQAFNVTDKLKDQKKFDALRAVVQDETLAQRPDIQQLKNYLDERQIAIDELSARKAAGGSDSLTSQANSDVYEWWEWTRLQYRNEDDFIDIFDRYLSRDNVDVLTWRTN